ncbi:hypothetical protein TWF481_002413 [Arthrobotrys musiformis]|uniref:Uncharacterized protein n=1 Tax=Arthrobotrys musiformis TaxID=47236 RepID=A0AAV9VU68_9PEZI
MPQTRKRVRKESLSGAKKRFKVVKGSKPPRTRRRKKESSEPSTTTEETKVPKLPPVGIWNKDLEPPATQEQAEDSKLPATTEQAKDLKSAATKEQTKQPKLPPIGIWNKDPKPPAKRRRLNKPPTTTKRVKGSKPPDAVGRVISDINTPPNEPSPDAPAQCQSSTPGSVNAPVTSSPPLTPPDTTKDNPDSEGERSSLHLVKTRHTPKSCEPQDCQQQEQSPRPSGKPGSQSVDRAEPQISDKNSASANSNHRRQLPEDDELVFDIRDILEHSYWNQWSYGIIVDDPPTDLDELVPEAEIDADRNRVPSSGVADRKLHTDRNGQEIEYTTNGFQNQHYDSGDEAADELELESVVYL